MTLFRYLNDDALLILSRKFRFLYEAALLDTYERFSLVVRPSPHRRRSSTQSTVSSSERQSLPTTTLAKACLT
uniref:Uncharacterized protein n=1 Tax=Rhizobium loti TaxID=381 RepID=Q8KGM0_RHILI|nr:HYPOTHETICAL PROTEIN [Mesorhizobium japonicum R7A]